MSSTLPNSNRCSLCSTFTIASLAGGNVFNHYPTIAKLQTSAIDGCDLCALIWHSINASTTKEIMMTAMKQRTQQIIIMPNSLSMKCMKELGGHSAYDELWITCGSEEKIQGIWGRVDLVTSRGSSLAKYFTGREITLDPSSSENFTDIKAWLEVCANHQICGKLVERPLPKRILDVGEFESQKVQLRVTEGQMGAYIALSYCWGRSQALVTTMDTLDQNLQGIPISQLPGTLAHAVKITKELGYRYIWIDALCIIQARSSDDKPAIADWQDQASKMAEIYGNAFLTIAAAGAADKYEGCFIPRTPTLHGCKVPLSAVDSDTIIAWPHEGSRYQKNLLEDRAWCFQEAVLSQRLLNYGKNEISFLCKTGRQSERFAKGDIPLPKGGIRIRGPQVFPPFASSDTERDEIALNWYRILEHDFCGRSITSESDILPALSGVAHRFHTSLGGNYYAGLWEVDLVRSLLWKCMNVIPQGEGIYLQHRSVYCAPSWSWASMKGNIRYGFTADRNRRWREAQKLNQCPVEIRDIQTTLVGPAYDPFGQISGGFMTLTALARGAVVVSKSVNNFRKKVKIYSNGAEIISDYSPLGNHHLLVGNEVVDVSDPEVVGALGHFDTEDLANEAPPVLCLFLWPNEGLMLVPDAKFGVEGDCFKRVGALTVYRGDWLGGAVSKCVTIV